jgi:HJR/Mrr/RecB family endonuclease
MTDNIGFPKLEAMLSTMSSEDFSNWLACMHLKVTYVDFCFWSSGWLDGIIYLSFHFYVLWGFLLSKALRKKRNVEDEAVQKEIMKLRSEVSGLRFDCDEKEKSFKILEKDFIESRTKVQAMCEEKSKLGETMGRKISELKASNAEKDNWIASLEAELKRAKEEYEAKKQR